MRATKQPAITISRWTFIPAVVATLFMAVPNTA